MLLMLKGSNNQGSYNFDFNVQFPILLNGTKDISQRLGTANIECRNHVNGTANKAPTDTSKVMKKRKSRDVEVSSRPHDFSERFIVGFYRSLLGVQSSQLHRLFLFPFLLNQWRSRS